MANHGGRNGRSPAFGQTIRDSVQAFAAGLLRPSFASVLGALSIFAIQCLFLERVFVWVGSSAWVAPELDEAGQAALDSLRLSRETDFRDAGVVVTGASPCSASLDRADGLEREIQGADGPRTRAYLLCSGGQSFWEDAAIFSRLPAAYHGVVVIGLGYLRFIKRPEDLRALARTPRMPLDAGTLAEEAAAAGIDFPKPTGIFAWDNLGFFAVNLNSWFRSWAGAGAGRSRLIQAQIPVQKGGAKVPTSAIRKEFETMKSRGEGNLAVLDRVVGKLSGRPGVRVVLLESPLQPGLPKELAEPIGEYTSRMEAFARARNIPYWNLNAESRLEAGDFRDPWHLNTPGARGRYRAALGARLRALLSGH